MLNILLLASLSLAPSASSTTEQQGKLSKQAESSEAMVDPARIEEAVKALEFAFKKGKTPDRVREIEAYGDIDDDRVIKLLAKGLKDRETRVQATAINALRWLEKPSALDALHTSLRRDKRIVKVDDLYVDLVTAIGQHADVSSIELLTKESISSLPKKVSSATIYSLGNIRDRKSVAALMEILERTGRAGKGGGMKQPFMKQCLLPLQVLTGEDFGMEEAAWSKWWRANKKTLVVHSELPPLKPKVQSKWSKYWSKPKQRAEGEEEKGSRGSKRERKKGTPL